MTRAASVRGRALLGLLLRVNLLQGWRRLLAVREQSRLLSLLIGLFILGYLGLAFLLFRKGLEFLGTFPGLGSLLIERLIFLLFAFLFVLLLLSNLVIGYTNFFRNRETAFLLTVPAPAQTVFQWKFLESALLASWAFVFLIAPLLAAFGLTAGAPWHFYPVTVGLIGLFIVLPAVGGAWVAVNLARYLDRRLFQVAALAVGIGLLVGAVIWLKPQPVTEGMLETRVLAVLDRLLRKTQFADFPFLPSYWLSASVLDWSEGALGAAVFFILVLLSYVLFFGFLSFTKMGAAFYEAASAVQSRGGVFARWAWLRRWQERTRRPNYAPGPIELVLSRLAWLRPDVRAVLVKDVRMFWRDPAQWGQTVVLFGLLGAYIINLRNFSRQLTQPFWVNLVSYLNLGACSLNLATLTTRFVYPQFSLEGRRLWIVGLAPLGLVRLIKAKFGLASCASLVATLGLVWLSCQMLKMPWARTLYFSAAITVMTFSLNGLAIGLGVLYPNLKEEHPSKIVSGFGGTFCLVLSFVYILGSVGLLAFRFPSAQTGMGLALGLGGGWLGFITLSLLLGWLPLRLGLRKVASFEW